MVAVQTKIQQAVAQGQQQSPMEAMLLSLYQYLLRKPASEADELINKALGITTQAPPPPQQNELLQLHAQAGGGPAPQQQQQQQQHYQQQHQQLPLQQQQQQQQSSPVSTGRDPMGGRGRGVVSPRGRGAVSPRGRGRLSAGATGTRLSPRDDHSGTPPRPEHPLQQDGQQQRQPQEDQFTNAEQEEWYRPPPRNRDQSELLKTETGEQFQLSYYRKK